METYDVEDDEDLLGDPIKLCFGGNNRSGCKLDKGCDADNSSSEAKIEIIDLTVMNDSENKSEKLPPERHEDCYQIKQLTIKVVDCGKFPWYYRKYVKNTNIWNRDDDEVIEIFDDDIETTLSDITQNTQDKKEEENSNHNMCLKIKYDTDKREWQVQEKKSDASTQTTDNDNTKSIPRNNLNKIDFKRNRGLVGLTITQKNIEDKNDLQKTEAKVTKQIKSEPKDEDAVHEVANNSNVPKLCGPKSKKNIEVTIKKENIDANVCISENQNIPEENSNSGVVTGAQKIQVKVEPVESKISTTDGHDNSKDKHLDCSFDKVTKNVLEKNISVESDVSTSKTQMTSQAISPKDSVRTDVKKELVESVSLDANITLEKNLDTNSNDKNKKILLQEKLVDTATASTAEAQNIPKENTIDRSSTTSPKNILVKKESVESGINKSDVQGNLSNCSSKVLTDSVTEKVKSVKSKEAQKVYTDDAIESSFKILNEKNVERESTGNMNDCNVKAVTEKVTENIASKMNTCEAHNIPTSSILDCSLKFVTEKIIEKIMEPNFNSLPRPDMLQQKHNSQEILRKEEEKLKVRSDAPSRNTTNCINYNDYIIKLPKSDITSNKNKNDHHYFPMPSLRIQSMHHHVPAQQPPSEPSEKESKKGSNSPIQKNSTNSESKKQRKEIPKLVISKSKNDVNLDPRQLNIMKSLIEKVSKHAFESNSENIEKCVNMLSSKPAIANVTTAVNEKDARLNGSANTQKSLKGSIIYETKVYSGSITGGVCNNAGQNYPPNFNTPPQRENALERKSAAPTSHIPVIQSFQCSQPIPVSRCLQAQCWIPPTSTIQPAAPSTNLESNNSMSTATSKPRIKYTCGNKPSANQHCSVTTPQVSHPPGPQTAVGNLDSYATVVQLLQRPTNILGSQIPSEQYPQINQPSYHYSYGPYPGSYIPGTTSNGGLCASNLNDVNLNYYYQYHNGFASALPPPPPPPQQRVPPHQTPHMVGNDNYNQYSAVIHNPKSVTIRNCYPHNARQVVTSPWEDNLKISSKGNKRTVKLGDNCAKQNSEGPNLKTVEHNHVLESNKSINTKKEMLENLNKVVIVGSEKHHVKKKTVSTEMYAVKRLPTQATNKISESPPKRLKYDSAPYMNDPRDAGKKNGANSLPILPITTYENDKDPNKIAKRDGNVSKPKSKMPSDEKNEKARVISIEEYKRRISVKDNSVLCHSSTRSIGYPKGAAGYPPKSVARKAKDRKFSWEQDLGYSSDTTVKL